MQSVYSAASAYYANYILIFSSLNFFAIDAKCLSMLIVVSSRSYFIVIIYSYVHN